MKIKVGQWVRLTNNIIVVLENNLNVENDRSKNDIYMDKEYGGYIIKVADTPQGLIQVGDLVALNHHPNYIKQVLAVEGNIIFNQSRCTKEQVCKIFTPNSNGDYIKQWEAE